MGESKTVEQHWTPEETRAGWGIRYSPTPGGILKPDGSRTYSLSFIALEITDMVSEPESAATAIARELNAHGQLVEALKAVSRKMDKHGDPDTALHDMIDAALQKADGRHG